MSKTSAHYSKLSSTERKALAERVFVVYPRLAKILGRIKHCHEYSRISAEPECMFIGGCQGAGKTTLYQHYMQQFPRTVDDNGTTNVPVLAARIPNRATDKALATRLLTVLGDPAAQRGSTTNQTLRLESFIRDCKVWLIILDEFQHFVDRDSKKILKSVSDWLKNLIDETGVPIILIGMPYADEVLDAIGNEQLQRRFAVRESLDPLNWTGRKDCEFRGFLKMLDDQLPLMERSHLADTSIAWRFYCATNGVVSKVMNIARKATELAIDQSLETLTLDLLADAYDDRLKNDNPNRKNPFSCDPKDLKVLPLKVAAPILNEESGDSESGEETASDVLRK